MRTTVSLWRQIVGTMMKNFGIYVVGTVPTAPVAKEENGKVIMSVSDWATAFVIIFVLQVFTEVEIFTTRKKHKWSLSYGNCLENDKVETKEKRRTPGIYSSDNNKWIIYFTSVRLRIWFRFQHFFYSNLFQLLAHLTLDIKWHKKLRTTNKRYTNDSTHNFFYYHALLDTIFDKYSLQCLEL